MEFVKLIFAGGRHRYADASNRVFMEFVSLVLVRGIYQLSAASNIKMSILGNFFTDDVGCKGSLFGRWAIDDSMGFAVDGNTTQLEKEGDYIIMSDLYSEEETPTQLKISRQQFVALFDFWEEKVCKLKPKEVMIKYDNGEFSIEIKD